MNTEFGLSILAYLDPGTGSMIIQMIVGAVVGTAYLLRSYFYKLIHLLTGGRSSQSSEE